jgi:hypothetical protein
MVGQALHIVHLRGKKQDLTFFGVERLGARTS